MGRHIVRLTLPGSLAGVPPDPLTVLRDSGRIKRIPRFREAVHRALDGQSETPPDALLAFVVCN
jgi:hypothetical protein